MINYGQGWVCDALGGGDGERRRKKMGREGEREREVGEQKEEEKECARLTLFLMSKQSSSRIQNINI